jgi:GNAT superfamily N-acetyltransferase
MSPSSDKTASALIAALPDTAAGRQLAWWLEMIADEGVRVTPADRDRFAPAMHGQVVELFDPDHMHAIWKRDAARLGAPVELSVTRSSAHDIAVDFAGANGRKWTVSVSVEPEPPHRMATFRLERRHDFQLEVREATPADALILADIERRCPIVMGDTKVWFERGSDYFAFARLMEDCTIGLASVDGVPAAVSCGAEHQVRVGGVMKKTVTVSHLRVLPEHQRKGLWGAANRVLEKYWPRVDGSNAYIAVDNAPMQHGFEGTPNKWPQTVQRVSLDCQALAGPGVGRAATPRDAGEIVRRLNAFHGGEEMFVPYTEARFTARLARAPDLYGWDKVWMTEGAVLGVWPAGNALRSIAETGGVRAETVPALVLDYAFAPGAEAEFEALLRAACARLAPQGMETLLIYTSPASTGSALIRGLARSTGEFFMWTPGIPVPPGAEARGLYVDPVYF